MAKCYLTTVDNPYDPSVDYDKWETEDMRLGYSTNCYLARIATLFHDWNEDMSDEEKDACIENAIDEIITYDFMDIYRKIKKE